jgi:hypothetical protein
MFAGIVLFGVYSWCTPAYSRYFIQYYLPCVCSIASLALLSMIYFACFRASFNSFNAPISLGLNPLPDSL